MCGIAGILSKNANTIRVRRILSLTAHRGDQDCLREVAETPLGTIGTNRLAIVDPLHGQQRK